MASVLGTYDYKFAAIDQPLTAAQQREQRAVSTRGRRLHVTHLSFRDSLGHAEVRAFRRAGATNRCRHS